MIVFKSYEIHCLIVVTFFMTSLFPQEEVSETLLCVSPGHTLTLWRTGKDGGGELPTFDYAEAWKRGTIVLRVRVKPRTNKVMIMVQRNARLNKNKGNSKGPVTNLCNVLTKKSSWVQKRYIMIYLNSCTSMPLYTCN